MSPGALPRSAAPSSAASNASHRVAPAVTAGMLKEAALAVSLLATGVATAPKLETIGPLKDLSAPETVRSVLGPGGERVLLPEGPWCEVWLRSSIPAGKNSAPGALRADLGVS